MAPGSAPATVPQPSFSADLRLPVDVYAADGTRVEKGEYTVQVKQDAGRFTLVFLQGTEPKATIKGETLSQDATAAGFSTPLIGTQFLRSSADPVGTETERHWSRNGLPRYQNEGRDWKATLRAYSSDDNKDVVWIFEERQSPGKWSHVEFKMFLNRP